MTQRYPRVFWDVFHGMFTTDEMNAIEEWGFENVAILTLELMVARHTAAIHTGSTSWFPELRTAQKAAYVEIKQWYETNVRPAIDAEKAIESNWFMGGKNAEQLKHTIDQIEKEKGKAIMQEALQQPVIDKPGTLLPEGYYWKELSNGTVTIIHAVGSGCFSEQARYIQAIPPTFPPRIPAKVDTVLYRLIRDVGSIKAGYLFWGLEIPDYGYDRVKQRGFNRVDIEEVKQ